MRTSLYKRLTEAKLVRISASENWLRRNTNNKMTAVYHKSADHTDMEGVVRTRIVETSSERLMQLQIRRLRKLSLTACAVAVIATMACLAIAACLVYFELAHENRGEYSNSS